MMLKNTIAALAATTLGASAVTVVTSNGVLSALDDANQAGPMWGQSITANVGADTADGLIPTTIYIESLSYQYSSSASGGVPGDFMHVYDSFTTNANGTIATVGNLIAVSDDANIAAAPAGNTILTWTFGGEAIDAINKSTEYWYISASDAVAATDVSNGNLVGGGYELATNNPYAGGESLRGNATSSGWDQDFALTTNTVVVPEPSSAALLGLVGLALIRRRRK